MFGLTCDEFFLLNWCVCFKLWSGVFASTGAFGSTADLVCLVQLVIWWVLFNCCSGEFGLTGDLV